MTIFVPDSRMQILFKLKTSSAATSSEIVKITKVVERQQFLAGAILPAQTGEQRKERRISAVASLIQKPLTSNCDAMQRQVFVAEEGNERPVSFRRDCSPEGHKATTFP